MRANLQSKCGGARVTTAESSARQPLVTVVTVVFNGANDLEPTIQSVIEQRQSDLEYIIIDGGSTDETLDLIIKYEHSIDYWVSEPDKGIYDAMNKGIAAATGKYILHINAGDRLLSVPTAELLDCLKNSVNVATFRVQLDDGSLHVPKGPFSMLISNAWHHQGTFYSRDAHLGYDTSYRVFADFDHNQRMAKGNTSLKIFDKVVAYHENTGLSSSMKHFDEVFRSIRKNSGIFFLPIAYVTFKIDGLRRRLSVATCRVNCWPRRMSRQDTSKGGDWPK